ncbi:hypothetical protein ANN_24050 [Periplaneta americana]|uniref:Uncharacterized protein n=1 Tax=Periplaneta americana TaxID=6978 RepID=A0ABQ8S201_PERAM|nr:hypothetical protein ANN_24050 [Periplaneta americana]
MNLRFLKSHVLTEIVNILHVNIELNFENGDALYQEYCLLKEMMPVLKDLPTQERWVTVLWVDVVIEVPRWTPFEVQSIESSPEERLLSWAADTKKTQCVVPSTRKEVVVLSTPNEVVIVPFEQQARKTKYSVFYIAAAYCIFRQSEC